MSHCVRGDSRTQGDPLPSEVKQRGSLDMGLGSENQVPVVPTERSQPCTGTGPEAPSPASQVGSLGPGFGEGPTFFRKSSRSRYSRWMFWLVVILMVVFSMLFSNWRMT